MTPFKNDKVDGKALKELIEFQIAGGTQGIVPCGISEHGVTSLVDLGLPVTMADLDVALKEAYGEVFSV